MRDEILSFEKNSIRACVFDTLSISINESGIEIVSNTQMRIECQLHS